MTPDHREPTSFPAADFEPGDRFAFAIRPDDEYKILDRTDRPNQMVEFQVVRSNEAGAEPIYYIFTFPAQMPVPARLRRRIITRPCDICGEVLQIELDTARSALESLVCGSHAAR